MIDLRGRLHGAHFLPATEELGVISAVGHGDFAGLHFRRSEKGLVFV